jgi:nitric oxide reductase NorE protein
MSVFGAVAIPRRGTAPSPPARAHVPGEPGLWIVLFGDIAVFTILFVVYLAHRGENAELFAHSQQALNRTFGAVNTLVLLSSSLLIVLAVRAYRSDQRRHLTPRLAIAGMAVGSCFVAIKIVEYHEMVAAGITPSTNEFYMYYFVLTGLHLFHVTVGLIVLLVLVGLARNTSPTLANVAFFEGGACFWHMVDLLWIIIFPLLFLVR